MTLVDTHTHLFAEEFDKDRTMVIQLAINAGVKKLFLPNIEVASFNKMMEVCGEFPDNCFPMLGLHPCSVKADYQKQLDELFTHLPLHKFAAIGEIGIDLYWDKTFVDEQKQAFRWQIEMAKKHQLPIVIHTRNSFNEAFEIVNELNDDFLKGIFHCFSGGIEDADKIISLGGFKMGIGGVLTFKNSGSAEVVKQIPMQHLVLETDSPYLAPVPHRGKRNESSYLLLVAQKLAEIKSISLEEVAEVTTENAKEIFGI